MELFGTLARLLGYSNREIERRANLNHAWASKVFQGQAEPKLELLLKIIEAVGLDYGEFFDLAYGDRRQARPTEAAQRIRRMLEGLQPGPLFGAPVAPARKEERAPDTRETIDGLKEIVRKVSRRWAPRPSLPRSGNSAARAEPAQRSHLSLPRATSKIL